MAKRKRQIYMFDNETNLYDAYGLKAYGKQPPRNRPTPGRQTDQTTENS